MFQAYCRLTPHPALSRARKVLGALKTTSSKGAKNDLEHPCKWRWSSPVFLWVGVEAYGFTHSKDSRGSGSNSSAIFDQVTLAHLHNLSKTQFSILWMRLVIREQRPDLLAPYLSGSAELCQLLGKHRHPWAAKMIAELPHRKWRRFTCYIPNQLPLRWAQPYYGIYVTQWPTQSPGEHCWLWLRFSP